MIDITNKKFNKLKAIKFFSKDKYNNQIWVFICDCGTTKKIYKGAVMSGHTKSCGCFLKSKEMQEIRKRPRTHGMRNTRIYSIWKNMLGRVRCSTNQDYSNYGGRGINIDKKWIKFEGFYEDMSDGYKENLTIDRINNNKGYSKKNCRWVTTKEQNRNKRNVILFKGETAVEASIRLGGNLSLVSKRILMGWSKEKAFTVQICKK